MQSKREIEWMKLRLKHDGDFVITAKGLATEIVF